MMTKPTGMTPGPWHTAGQYGRTVRDSRAGLYVVVAGKGADERNVAYAIFEPDARAIAKLPELVEALREAHKYFRNRPGNVETQLNEMIGALLATIEGKEGAKKPR